MGYPWNPNDKLYAADLNAAITLGISQGLSGLGSPPPIGDVTPNTGRFSALSSTGTASLGTGSAAWITATGGAQATLGVGGTGNQIINLRSGGTAQVQLGGSAFSMLQLFPAATNGGILSITQPAAVGSQITFDATAGNTAGFLFQPRIVIGRATTLTNTSVSPFWLNVGNTISGTQTGNTHQTMVNIGTTVDTLDTDGGNNMLTVNNSMTTGWSGSRCPVKVLVTDTAATPLSANDHFMVGITSTATMKFNQGGVSTGYGTTQFGEGNAWGIVTQAEALGTNTYLGTITGIEIDVTATAGTQILGEYGLMIVHEGTHAVQGLNNSSAIMIGDQVTATTAWRNLMSLGNYSARWPLDPNGYLIQVRSNGNPTPVGAGGIDLNQMTVTGSGAEGGGFFWRSPGMRIRDTEAQVGYGTITNNATGLSIDATYRQMATAAGSITIAAGGTNFTTGDIVTDAYGNTLKVTAAGGVVTAINAVLTRGWQTSPPADPVPVTARTRTGATIGSGLTVNYGAWTAQTGITIGGSASKLGFYNATPVVKQTGVAVSVAGIHAALTNLGLIAP